MSRLALVALPVAEGLVVQITPPAKVQLSGVLAKANPERTLGPFFAQLHQAAVADSLRELTVDLRLLTFVNSSAIRLFVDWATWLRNDTASDGYVLRFRTDRRITWQRTSFLVLQSLAPQRIVIVSE